MCHVTFLPFANHGHSAKINVGIAHGTTACPCSRLIPTTALQVDGILTYCSALQSQKAFTPICSNPSQRSTSSNALQKQNTDLSITLTVEGTRTLRRDMHSR